jgi:tripartite-type tricarboxylate transporter receptor subunit TctC
MASLFSGATRREVLLAGSAVPFALVPKWASAQADEFPSHEIKIACAFPPGAGADVWVRFFVEQARPFIGKPAIVENKPGGNGAIATEYVARSRPDGYTMLMQSPTSLAANMFMFKNPGVDPKTSLVTVATMLKFSFYLLADVKQPWKNAQDVIAYTRRKGDKTSFATTSAPGRLMGNLFKEIMGLKCVEVAYRTSNDALNDIQSGAIDYMFSDGVFAHAQRDAGRLKILGVGSRERMKADPDIPTLEEQGVKGLEVPGFFGVLVPAGTPRPVIDKINGWYLNIMKTKETLDFIKRTGGDPLVTTPDEAQKLFLQSVDDWERLVKRANIKPEG